MPVAAVKCIYGQAAAHSHERAHGRDARRDALLVELRTKSTGALVVLAALFAAWVVLSG